MRGSDLPTARTITVKETIDLLDGQFADVAKGVAEGSYAFWLGSGISRERVIGLDGVLSKLIEFLRSHATTDPDCRFIKTFDRIIELAEPTPDERATIDLSKPATDWPCLKNIVSRLWGKYSEVLSQDVDNEKRDYLLWDALDFPNTFANQQADAEHLAIAILALEGAVSEIATPNWDGLLEGALVELGHPLTSFQITVEGADLRGPPAATKLYKFHGCALRAIEQENEYRKLLIARADQIIGWMDNATFTIVRDQLSALIQRTRTLMIGLSAQDANIQRLFGKAGAIKGWNWDASPPPIMFAADQLTSGQTTVLSVAYGDDYEGNRQQISASSLIRAYGKQLLLALVLSVTTQKLEMLAGDASAPNLSEAGRDGIAAGLRHLRDSAANAADGDRLAAIKRFAQALSRAKFQLQNGENPVDAVQYFPLDRRPSHQMKGDIALAVTGQREAANALGLIGLIAQTGDWAIGLDDPADPASGALRITSSVANARVFFAANDDNIASLIECGAFAEDDADAVLLCSKRVTARQQRNPSANYRTGVSGPRYIAFGPMLHQTADLDSLLSDFRAEVAI
ncbi:SIR2 family protein (plasmid) [Rhizobium ruizarguesonis]|uniref:SIR2 family protein n=1 Tax=Rhizobium ruizarguesonis TaxID=2081791 RepID=A0AB38HTT4_9HYPH|nr:SIR2 family protein [Rhizobium ruizarguesonis]TBB58501.1 SIR2 family protein [Rhizobium ruizarguesonis]TBB60444.1 SIR2 family protein [Rhizobium ruizarguesonis]TBB83501.1 SIR2 family protein [Rhizobium ruizarguesonis]TBC04672.1 SIR2 family protein [Rhizobium ruizarguesonis]